MPNSEIEVAKKLLPIIFVIDTSGSMAGELIASVNEAMRDSLDTLKSVADDNADAEVLVGALGFSTGCKWLTNGLLTTEDFYWNDADADGMTYLGAALDELDSQMSRSKLFANKKGYNMPVLIFMSDGFPNDDWEKALGRIQQNKWFQNSIKVGIAIGDDADRDVLTKIIGSREGLVEVNNQVQLKNMIKRISLSASKIGSVSHNASQSKDVAGEIIADATGKTPAPAAAPAPAPASAPASAPAPDPSTGGSIWEEDDWK